MSLLLRISAHHLILSHSKFHLTTNPRVSASLRPRKLRNLPPDSSLHRPFFSASRDDSVSSLSDVESSSVDKEDVHENKNHAKEPLASNETLEKLKRYGISGILSYGLLNTTYYLATFLLVWFYFAPAPGKMGYLAAVERFLKVMAMVWAGSQVTKLVRAGGALALAPFVDRGLSWFAVKYKFESREKAFFTIVGFCFGLAVILFLAVTVISA